MKVGVMEGRLNDFDLTQVLQVVGLGRQYTGVELRSGDRVAGTIFVKGGKVVRVDAPGAFGRDAFHKLFRLENGSFSVFRMDTPEELPEPLGALNRLLLELAAREDVMEADSRQPEQRNHVEVREVPEEGRALRDTLVPVSVPPAESMPLAESVSPTESRPPAESTSRKKVEGRVIAVASPKGGCGKTTVALNLALSLARQGRSVLLIDGDINGDLLSSVNGRARARAGVFDILCGGARPQDALLKTVLPNLSLIAATGSRLPELNRLLQDHTEGWRHLLSELSQQAELLIVDTPAGMFGETRQILSCATHVLGVLQAEAVANRSFVRFQEGLEGLPNGERPQVLGVFLNMLQTRHGASLAVFHDACTQLPEGWFFETTIPRTTAFLDATDQGLPLRHINERTPPAVAFLFDNLASEVATRLALVEPEEKASAFLL